MLKDLSSQLRTHPALWPRAWRRGLAVGVALGTAVGVAWLSVSWGEGAQARQQAQQLEGRWQTVQARQTQLQTARQSLSELQARLQAQQAAWPAPGTWSMHTLLQGVQHAARAHGVVVHSMQPGAPTLQDTHAEWPAAVSLQGAYPQLLGFLRAMAELSQANQVQDMQWRAQDHGQLHVEARVVFLRLLTPSEQATRPQAQAQAQAQAQRANAPVAAHDKTHAQAAVKPAGPAPVPVWAQPVWRAGLDDPFDTARLSRALQEHQALNTEPTWLAAERARAPQWLERYTLAQLELVGSLQQGTDRLALVRAEQRIHPVRLGQYLGPHSGRVVALDERSLTLRELYQDEAGQWQQRLVKLELVRPS